MYIELGGSHAFNDELVPNSLLTSLQATQHPLDSKICQAQLHIVDGVTVVSDSEQEETIRDLSHTGRTRRKVHFEPEGGSEGDAENTDSESESSGEEEDMKMMAGTKQRARRAYRPKNTSQMRRKGSHVHQFFDQEAEEGEEDESTSSEKYSTDPSCQEEDSFFWEEVCESVPSAPGAEPLSGSSSLESEEADCSGSLSEEEDGADLLPGHLRWKESLSEKARVSYGKRVSKAKLL